MVVRKFEIELDVPDDFDDEYGTLYTISPRTVITNGKLVWNVYCDKKKPEPQWIKATRKDEGKQVRCRDHDDVEWAVGKLLHVMPGVPFPYLVLNGSDIPVYCATCEAQL